MNKILILYGFEHSGHHAAALALREAFLKVDPALEVNILNFFAYASRVLERMSTRAFFRVVKSTPSIWEDIYNDPRSEARFTRFRKVVRTLSPRGVDDALDIFAPDVVVCTQCFPCGMVSDYKEARGIDIPLYAVLTDFNAPSYWNYSSVDLYFVACREAKQALASGGIDECRIIETGIPISPRFSLSVSKDEARRIFGLPAGSPVILVMGGWSGWGPLEGLAVEILKAADGCTVAVVAGRNRGCYERLKVLRAKYGSSLRVMPFVSSIEILMSAADLLVGKAGGMTASEALAVGLPLILVDSLPGQERANAQYLCGRGAALEADNVDEAASIVLSLLSSPGTISSMRRRAIEISRPCAAVEVVERILEEADVRSPRL